MAEEEKGKPISVWIADEDKPLLEKLEKAAELDKRKLSPMIVKILEENVDKYLKR